MSGEAAIKYRASFQLCCDNYSVEDTSIRSRHARGFVAFCGVLSGLRPFAVLDWSIFIFIFATVSCTVESLTSVH